MPNEKQQVQKIKKYSDSRNTEIQDTEAKRPGRPKGSVTGTRHALPTRIDFSAPSNFREESARGVIFNRALALSKNHTDTRSLVDAIVNELEPEIGVEPFLFKKREDRRPMDEIESKKMLRFTVNRTLFDYARLSGQHESAKAE